MDKHTDYLVTVSAKNLKGFGPEDSIELRTEDGGKKIPHFIFISFSFLKLITKEIPFHMNVYSYVIISFMVTIGDMRINRRVVVSLNVVYYLLMIIKHVTIHVTT